MATPNVVFLVVDALCHNSLNRKVGGQWVMPHLRKLAQDNVSWNNIYSLAPYTEAALVSLLGGDRTMEHGGYFFGNAGCAQPLMQQYQDAGYRTLLGYSPYVYSKAYLKGVTDTVYTRRYSILPLYMYRLDEYGRLFKAGELSVDQLKAAVVLIGEALETWSDQVRCLLDGDTAASLIAEDGGLQAAKAVKGQLDEHMEDFRQNPLEYSKAALNAGREGELIALSEKFNDRPPLPMKDQLLDAYQSVLEEKQLAVSKAAERTRIGWRYPMSTLLNDKGGMGDFIGLLRRSRSHRKGRVLSDYLFSLDGNSKVESSAPLQLGYVREWAEQRRSDGIPFAAYVQFQDFHLPSVFHTTDSHSWLQVSQEMESAIDLLESVTGDYSGNIVADLSAHYVDSKIHEFMEFFNEELAGDSVLVITADHGFPCYDDPPRPYVYNQTYVEAFHVPFIVCAPQGIALPQVRGPIVDSLSLVGALTEGILEGRSCPVDGDYVISEYGGPGCPDMTKKEIWYTYIDERYRISAECGLGERLGVGHVKTVMDLRADPEERCNMVRRAERLDEVMDAVGRISERHERLRQKGPADEFLSRMLQIDMIRDDLHGLGLQDGGSR